MDVLLVSTVSEKCETNKDSVSEGFPIFTMEHKHIFEKSIIDIYLYLVKINWFGWGESVGFFIGNSESNVFTKIKDTYRLSIYIKGFKI